MFGRLNIPSDPVVNFFDPLVTCSFCSGIGHSKLSCTLAKAKTASDLSHDDLVFWSFVHPEDRPECLKEFDFDSEEENESDTDSESDEGEPDTEYESDTDSDSDFD